MKVDSYSLEMPEHILDQLEDIAAENDLVSETIMQIASLVNHLGECEISSTEETKH
jgi:hypothetical protein